jgi:hypothetical protein
MKRLTVAAFCAVSILVVSEVAAADDKSPQTWIRSDYIKGEKTMWCAPTPRDHSKEDKHVAGLDANNNSLVDWLLKRSHWVDSSGNDVTVEEWCINGTLPYHSMRVLLSTKDNPDGKVVAVPEKDLGGNSVGEC